MTTDELIKELKELIKGGDEKQVRTFVVHNFKSFPPEYQRRFAVDLFSEAVDVHRVATKAIALLKHDIAGAIADTSEK